MDYACFKFIHIKDYEPDFNVLSFVFNVIFDTETVVRILIGCKIMVIIMFLLCISIFILLFTIGFIGVINVWLI